MKSIGAIDVKNALLKSRIQKSVTPFERASARMTNKASEVKNGLQTVETIRATSVQTRLRTRSGAGGGWDSVRANPRGTCTRPGFRRTPSNPCGHDPRTDCVAGRREAAGPHGARSAC